MNRDTATVLGLTLTAVGTSAAMFDRVLPPMHEVRGTPPTAAVVGEVRRHSMRVGALVLALGVGVSVMAGSPWPAVGVAATVGYLWTEYARAAASGATARVWA